VRRPTLIAHGWLWVVVVLAVVPLGRFAVYYFHTPAGRDGESITVDIPAGVANAIAGSGLPNRAAEQFRRTYAGPPGPTVDMLSPAPDPTNFSPIPVIATFSEPVTGFTASDLVVFNATVANFAVNPSSAAIYTFDLFPIQNGLVTADIPQGVALNALWRPNMAAPQFSRTFLDTRPAVTISSTTPDPTAETPFPLSVWFSEPVSGFDALDMNVSNASVFHASGFDGDQLYTFWITPQLPGLVTIDIPPGVAVGDAPPSGRVNTAAARFERTFTIVLRPKARVGREWMLYR